MILTGKAPGITKVGACIRQSRFSDPVVSSANRLWVGANNIANEKFALDLLVEGMVEHILRRAGDLRANKDTKPSGIGGTSSSAFIKRFDIGFTRRVEGGITGIPLERSVEYVINDGSSSFNGIVYNNIAGVAAGDENFVFYDGVVQSPIGSVLPTLQSAIFAQAVDGYYVNSIAVMRQDSANQFVEVFHDSVFGQLKVKMDIAGRHRFQNVTPASRTDGAMNGMNANSIDANPLTGKIFTFGHLSPRMAPSWLAGLVDNTQGSKDIEDLCGRPAVFTSTGVGPNIPNSCKYEELSSIRRDWPDIKQFDASPLRPRTLWSNVKTSGPVHFPPGGFKTFKTRFTYSGSISRFCKELVQQSDPATGRRVGSYPTLGGSFMMCLRPTMKTSGEEECTMAYDYEKIGKIQCSKFTHGSMATTNDIE